MVSKLSEVVDEPVVLRLASVASTQDAARQLPIGSVVTAEHQLAGRGRLGRRWEAPAGTALLATFVTAPHSLASLAAGVAVAEACGGGARLKWPNDVLIDGRKLAGILVEAPGGRCLVGVGINLTWAPDGAALLGPVDRDRLLERLLGGLERWFAQPPEAMLERYRELCDTLGRPVRVEIGAELMTGIAEAVAGDGSLVVDGRSVSAGDVTHLRTLGAGPGPPPRDRG